MNATIKMVETARVDDKEGKNHFCKWALRRKIPKIGWSLDLSGYLFHLKSWDQEARRSSYISFASKKKKKNTTAVSLFRTYKLSHCR